MYSDAGEIICLHLPKVKCFLIIITPNMEEKVYLHEVALNTLILHLLRTKFCYSIE